MTLKFREFKLQEPGYISGRKVCKSPSDQPGTSSSGDISFKRTLVTVSMLEKSHS